MIPFDDLEQIPFVLTPAERSQAAFATAWLERRRRDLNARDARFSSPARTAPTRHLTLTVPRER